MKFFLDTANLADIQKGVALGIIDGVTTNPSLIAKEGIAVEEQIRKICGLIAGDVSAEVVTTNAPEMITEGRRLSKIHPNVVVKVPCTPDGIAAVATLSKEDIRTNVTLCFSAAQTLLAARAGAYIVSPFIGRLDDLGYNGMELIRDTAAIYKNYGYKTQILAASVRGTLHVVDAAKAGAHISTLPFKVLEKLFKHPLTDQGLEQFLHDYNKAFELTRV